MYFSNDEEESSKKALSPCNTKVNNDTWHGFPVIFANLFNFSLKNNVNVIHVNRNAMIIMALSTLNHQFSRDSTGFW